MSSMLRTALLAAAAIAIGGCATPSGRGQGSDARTSGESGTPAVTAKSAGAESAAASPARAGGTAGGAPAAARTTTASAGGAGSAVPAQTTDERRAAIDRRLNDSLGTFDDELRREQERVAKERDERAASRAGTAEGEEGAENAQGPDAESGGEAEAEGPPMPGTEGNEREKDADGKRPGDLKSERERQSRSGNTAGTPNGAAAPNIPDGSDDDIVARRLRKAYETETDPELKEKLLKEYIEYKKNTQGQ